MELSLDDDISVNVKEIDIQHKKLISIINKLLHAIDEHSTHIELAGILHDLEDYSVQHFATEESYFKKFHFTDAKEHIAEHKKFTKKLKDLTKRYDTNSFEISYELVDFLEDWLLTHVKDHDKKYTKCFNDHGLY